MANHNNYIGTLKSGYQLYVSDVLNSTDGKYQLTLEQDGELTLYKIKKWRTSVWSAGLKGKNSLKAVMEADGSFIVFDKNGTAIWNSGTKGNPGAAVGFADDDRLVITKDSKTLWKSTRKHIWTLNSGEELLIGDSVVSPSGDVQLILQSDGNLVLLFKTNADSLIALWSTGTDGKSSHKASMQTDGNFVVIDNNNSPIWNAGTSTKTGARLFCQDDGVLFIHNYTNPSIVWSS